MGRERTCRSAKTPRILAPCIRRGWGASLPFPRWAGCITATSAAPPNLAIDARGTGGIRRPRPRLNDGSLSLALSLKLRGHEIKLLLHRMDRTYRPTRRYAWPPDSAATEFTIGTIPF